MFGSPVIKIDFDWIYSGKELVEGKVIYIFEYIHIKVSCTINCSVKINSKIWSYNF
jgi:hypothetical protein